MRLAAYASAEDVELAFQQCGIFKPDLSDSNGMPPEKPELMFAAYSKNIDWRDKDSAERGLDALTLVTERARAWYDQGRNWDEYEGYLGCAYELARKANRDGLAYDVDTGVLSLDLEANADQFVELDIDALHREKNVIDALQDLNDEIKKDLHSPRVAVQSRRLVEAVCFAILKYESPEVYQSFKKETRLDILTKEVNKTLDLVDVANPSSAMSQFAKGIEQLSRGIAEVRNRTGVAHGKEEDKPASPEEIRLALDATHTWCRYIIAEYKKKQDLPPW